MPKKINISTELVIHRLTFPTRDVRNVVKIGTSGLTGEVMTGGKSPDSKSIAKLKKEVAKYSCKTLTEVRGLLVKRGIRGPSTYSLTAGIVKLAEFDVETESMCKTDSHSRNAFANEEDAPDLNSRIDSSELVTYANANASASRSQFRDRAEGCCGVVLDEHQLAAIEKAKRFDLTLINAGPGTGKTTTICKLVSDLISAPKPPRILILSFTTQAEKVMIDKIKLSGGSEFIVSKHDIYHTPGVCVLTFDKFAYSLTSKIYPTFEQGKLEALSQLKKLSKQNKLLLDYLMVDECQDLSLIEYQMMKELRLVASKTVLAGDPRQECFADCSHFSRMWCTEEVSDRVSKVHLINNYRSCAAIVKVLNLFANKHFPNIGGTEPLVSKRGKCSEALRGDNCLKIFDCKTKAQTGVTIGRHLQEQARTDAYVISPMTVNVYGHDEVVLAIENHLHSSKALHVACGQPPKKKQRRTFKGSSKKGSNFTLLEGDSKVFIQTSMTLKGGEAESVSLFGFEARYNVEHFSKNMQLKLLYVAMSRAKDTLSVYLDYYTSNPTFLHMALEGSVLVKRFSNLPVSSLISCTPPTVLQLKVECSGANLDNAGGLSQCCMEINVKRDESLQCSLEIPEAFQYNQILKHMFIKQVVLRSVEHWLCSTDLAFGGSVVKSTLLFVQKRISSKFSTKFDSVDALMSDESTMLQVEKSASKFGLALTGVLLQLASCVSMSKLTTWPNTHISLETLGINSKDVESKKEVQDWFSSETFHEQITDDLLKCKSELGLASSKIELAYEVTGQMAFKSNNLTCILTGVADLLMTLEVGVDVYKIPVNLYSTSVECKLSALTRAAMCATLFGSPFGVMANTLTGAVLVVHAVPASVVSCLTRGTLLARWCCKRSTKNFPLPRKLATTSSIVVVHCERDQCDATKDRLCALYLNHFALTNAHSWLFSFGRGDKQFQELMVIRKLNEWLEIRAQRESLLVICTDERTKALLGSLLSSGEHLMYCDLCAEINSPYLPSQGAVLKHSKGILTNLGCSVDFALCHNSSFDTCIGIACVLKSAFTWDTMV